MCYRWVNSQVCDLEEDGTCVRYLRMKMDSTVESFSKSTSPNIKNPVFIIPTDEE